jgi:hypothetical protein
MGGDIVLLRADLLRWEVIVRRVGGSAVTFLQANILFYHLATHTRCIPRSVQGCCCCADRRGPWRLTAAPSAGAGAGGGSGAGVADGWDGAADDVGGQGAGAADCAAEAAVPQARHPPHPSGRALPTLTANRLNSISTNQDAGLTTRAGHAQPISDPQNGPAAAPQESQEACEIAVRQVGVNARMGRGAAGESRLRLSRLWRVGAGGAGSWVRWWWVVVGGWATELMAT